jgi:hypothetical protein
MRSRSEQTLTNVLRSTQIFSRTKDFRISQMPPVVIYYRHTKVFVASSKSSSHPSDLKDSVEASRAL